MDHLRGTGMINGKPDGKKRTWPKVDAQETVAGIFTRSLAQGVKNPVAAPGDTEGAGPMPRLGRSWWILILVGCSPKCSRTRQSH